MLGKLINVYLRIAKQYTIREIMTQTRIYINIMLINSILCEHSQRYTICLQSLASDIGYDYTYNGRIHHLCG